MKVVTAEQVVKTLGKVENARKLVRRLETVGLFGELSATLTAILSSEQSPSGQISDLKETLKLLTSHLIDDIARSLEATKTPSTATTARSQASEYIYAIDYSLLEPKNASKRPPQSAASPPRCTRPTQSVHSSPQPAHHKSASMHQIPQLRSVCSSPVRTQEELKAISDFAFPAPSVVFGKSPRRTLEVRDLSPGPAYYKPNTSSVKDKSTSALIQKSGKRYEYFIPESPGPAYYTPLRAFLARRLGSNS